MTPLTPDPIFQIASGFMAAKHLFVASEVGLFETLAAGPATLEELAQRLEMPPRTTRILADAMVTLGFVGRQQDRYCNGPIAEAFLTDGATTDMRPFLRFWNGISYPLWENLGEAMRTGQAQRFRGMTPEQFTTFSTGIEAITSGTALSLAVTYPFDTHRQILDLGGGTGSFLAAILHHYRNLKTTLYELPSVARLAREQLADDRAAAQITIVEGDFFVDPIPTDHDAIILANVLHLFSPEHNLELLRRIRSHVPDGARLLLVDFWTDPTHTQPMFATLMAGEFMLVSSEGDTYSEADVTGWLAQTGWQRLERKALTGPSSLIIAATE